MKGTEHPVQQKNEDKLIMSTISIVCSCGKDPTIAAGQKCPSFGHTATLVLAFSISKNLALSFDDAKSAEQDKSTENQYCPYIMVYDILTTRSETLAKPLFNVDNSMELEKELLLQDAYTPSSSEDDWMYDQMAPALSDTLHSSVLQKFAEAMSGEENGYKGKNTKSKEEPNKRAKFVQCLDLSDLCKGQCCKVSELVPFGDGQNLLVNLVCYGSCDNETDLAELNGQEGKIDEQATSSNNQEGETVSKTCTESLDFTLKDSTKENKRTFCYKPSFNQSKLVVYRINISNGGRTLSSQPFRTKQFSWCDGILTNIVALPVETHPLLIDSDVHLQEQESDISSGSQLLIGATNCNIVVIHANSLDILSKFTTGKEITHILNCPGMDCFCACMIDGMMYFLGLRNQLTDQNGLGSVESDGTYMTSESSGGSTSQTGKVN